MSEKKLDKKQNAVELGNESLESTSGGGKIIHMKGGYKALVDDNEVPVSKRFIDGHQAERYVRSGQAAKDGYTFNGNLTQEWSR